MYSFIEAKNACQLMKHAHERGELSTAEYRRWVKEQREIGW
jgi:hypothetical protein